MSLQTADDRLSPEETARRLRLAKLIEYGHGGGRLYFEETGARDLIADFYGEGHYRDSIMALIRAATATQPTEPVATGCEWKQSEDGQWDTSCGGTFEFVNGDPAMNGAKFCCYCGLALDQLPYEDEEVSDDE